MKFALLICLALLLVTCSGDDDRPNTCSVTDPVRQLGWLRNTIQSYENGPVDLEVSQGTFMSQTVFVLSPCCPVCAAHDFMVPPVYTCEGAVIEDLYQGDPRITDLKVIWKTPAEKAACW